MKTIIFFSLVILLFCACNSNSKQENNANQDEQQIMNTMQQSLDSNNAEIIMERDTTN